VASTDIRDPRKVFIPDPRPETVRRADDHFIRGMVCTSCGHASAVKVPWCPRCQAATTEKLYGPTGKVWSSTVVRIPIPNRRPPYSLAYVDLDDGPRVLAHVSAPDGRLAVGQAVRLMEATASGDIQVTAS